MHQGYSMLPKPSSLLEVAVLPDWQAIEAEHAAENARLWRFAQAAIAVTTLVALIIGPAGAPQIWRGLLHSLVLPLVLWLPPLWYLSRTPTNVRQGNRPLLPLGLALFGVIVLSCLLEFSFAQGWLDGQRSPLVVALAVAVPAGTWWLLSRLRRYFPDEMLRLGVTGKLWRTDAAVGVAAGCALGLYLMLMWTLVPGQSAVRWPAPAALSVILCSLLGPTLLGEELLFRGLTVRLLSGPEQRDLARTALRIGVINLYIYMIPIPGPGNPQLWVWRLVFGGLMILTATLLRYKLGNIVPGLICSVLFSLFMVVTFGT
jgi:hypothetical protein